MLHCLNSCGNLDTTVLERQSSKWQEPYFPATELNAVFSSVKPDPALSAHVEGGSSSSKKRKPHTHSHPKVVPPPETAKRVKASAEEEESRVSNKTAKSNREATSADTSKGSQVQNHNKPDYIHVRARRGQATDSHSLAERVRREKISERMKYLQDLVPGCNKIAGKAGMLDEIINYVQSLQRQVEFLSMKLAAVNPRLDCNIDELFAKEVFPSCCQSFPNIGMASDMTNNPAYLQFNSAQQLVSCGGGLANNMGISPTNMGILRNISNTTATTTPVPLLPEPSFDSSCFAQLLPSSNWEGDLQSLYSVSFGQERTASFPSQPFTDLVEASNLKMEM